MSEVVADEQIVTSSDELIVPRPRKNPRISHYLSVADLLDIFPEEAPGTLAMLAEAHESLPSEILELVPHITAVQLAEYGELVKKSQAARGSKPQVLDSTEILKAIQRGAARHMFLFYSYCFFLIDNVHRYLFCMIIFAV